MQLKITQKTLNLSFNDKILEETENSQENPQCFQKSSKNLASNYFEDPQSIFVGCMGKIPRYHPSPNPSLPLS